MLQHDYRKKERRGTSGDPLKAQTSGWCTCGSWFGIQAGLRDEIIFEEWADHLLEVNEIRAEQVRNGDDMMFVL